MHVCVVLIFPSSPPDSPREFNVEKKLGQQMSQVEFERQQILDEMRKRTHLHRDSSWIRQRSSSSSYQKEPILTGPSVRRSVFIYVQYVNYFSRKSHSHEVRNARHHKHKLESHSQEGSGKHRRLDTPAQLQQ